MRKQPIPQTVDRYRIAMSVSQDVGNRSMKKGNRTAWSKEDYAAAVKTFNALWKGEKR